MLNSEKFLNAFASIERYLRNQSGHDTQLTFYQLVDRVAKSNPAVRRFERDLKEYADLRNAIVHERGGGEVIAEPNERAVNGVEHIVSVLLKPPMVIPLFQTQVIVLAPSDPVANAVGLMLKHTISQIPIKAGNQLIGLLTTNTVARWLGTCVQDDIFSLKETTIEQVLQFTEDEDNYTFLCRSSTIFEALELFHQYENRGKRLEAILITANGQSSEQIIGIVTVADLPKALREIDKPLP